MRSPQNVFGTQKHARSEMCVEVIHIAVVTSRSRFLVSRASNHFVLEVVKLQNQRDFLVKNY